MHISTRTYLICFYYEHRTHYVEHVGIVVYYHTVSNLLNPPLRNPKQKENVRYDLELMLTIARFMNEY
jgi:hypothetical protein